MKSILSNTQRSHAVALLLMFGSVPLFHSNANSAQLALSPVPLFLTSSGITQCAGDLRQLTIHGCTMVGKLIAGDNAATRGNIGRQVIRDTISNYRTTFNWGLMSYGMSSNPPPNTAPMPITSGRIVAWCLPMIA